MDGKGEKKRVCRIVGGMKRLALIYVHPAGDA